MHVVINCDDLGLHPAVRRAVKDLGASGAVSSATLLANGPDFEASVRIQGVGLGVHLNLLRGAPLSPAARVPSLVGSDGRMLGSYRRLFTRYAAGGVDLDHVRTEWCAQIERVIDTGVRPTHLDSEKHIHAWPRLHRLAGDLARRYGIGWLRRPVEPLRAGLPAAGLIRVAALAAFSWAGGRRSAGVPRPDLCWGIGEQGPLLSPVRFRRYVTSLQPAPRVVEIVCHPGLPREDDPALDPSFGAMRVAAGWSVEHAMLRDPGWKTVMAELGADVVSYAQIEGEP